MRRLSVVLSFMVLVGVLAPATASAQDSGFGLGIILGDPNGISGKGYLGSGIALDGAVGFGVIDGGHLHAHVDFLWEFRIASPQRADIDLYVGVGPKIGVYFDADQFFVGARAPVGIDFKFRIPLDLFVEVAAGLWIIEDVAFDLDAAVGLRYWF